MLLRYHKRVLNNPGYPGPWPEVIGVLEEGAAYHNEKLFNFPLSTITQQFKNK